MDSEKWLEWLPQIAVATLTLLAWMVRRLFTLTTRVTLLEKEAEARDEQRKELLGMMDTHGDNLHDHNEAVLAEIRSVRDGLTKRIDDLFKNLNHG